MNRILIVEDEITISRLIAVSLRRAGYDCTVANDGSTAADLIAEHDFDLALLDIMLPGLDGYELLGYLRPLGVPVIFITAKGATKDRVRGLQLGADDTQPAGVVGMACPDLMLLGDEVELDPLAALAVHDALGPQDLAVVAGVQGREDPLNVRLGKHLGGLFAPGGEHLVGVVVMVVAGAVGIVALVVVVMVMRVFIVIVMVSEFAFFFVIVMVRQTFIFFHQLFHQFLLFHSLQNLFSAQLIPRSGDECRMCIMCSYITCYTLQLFLTQILCTAQNNGIGIFDLIIKELTKVFHIHTAFLCIRNRRKAIHTNFGFFRHSLYCSYYTL